MLPYLRNHIQKIKGLEYKLAQEKKHLHEPTTLNSDHAHHSIVKLENQLEATKSIYRPHLFLYSSKSSKSSGLGRKTVKALNSGRTIIALKGDKPSPSLVTGSELAGGHPPGNPNTPSLRDGQTPKRALHSSQGSNKLSSPPQHHMLHEIPHSERDPLQPMTMTVWPPASFPILRPPAPNRAQSEVTSPMTYPGHPPPPLFMRQLYHSIATGRPSGITYPGISHQPPNRYQEKNDLHAIEPPSPFTQQLLAGGHPTTPFSRNLMDDFQQVEGKGPNDLPSSGQWQITPTHRHWHAQRGTSPPNLQEPNSPFRQSIHQSAHQLGFNDVP